jgi:hypothetical protein
MADDSKSSNFGGNNFVWLLLAAATTYFVVHQVPLEASRPPATERSLSERIGEQHVDARLWQDPFAAVAETLAKSPELIPEHQTHQTQQCPRLLLASLAEARIWIQAS